MLDSRGFWYIMMGGALAGWIFAISGLIRPYEGRSVRKVWKSVLIGWAAGHPLELGFAIPAGRAAGLSVTRTVIKTMLFGFTWWVPVSRRVFTR